MELGKDSLQKLHLVLVLLNDNQFFLLLFATNHLFKHAIGNICENALDGNDKLFVESHWPVGTNCQWLISAEDDKHYINLEFEHLDVRTYELDYYPGIRGP